MARRRLAVGVLQSLPTRVLLRGERLFDAGEWRAVLRVGDGYAGPVGRRQQDRWIFISVVAEVRIAERELLVESWVAQGRPR